MIGQSLANIFNIPHWNINNIFCLLTLCFFLGFSLGFHKKVEPLSHAANCIIICRVQEILKSNCFYKKKILNERNCSFKTMVHKPLLKTLGSYLICQCK